MQFLLITRCIPYKFKEVDEPAIEVLVVSSQKGPELMFPKVDAPLSHLICNLLYQPMLYDQPQGLAFFRQGGWELDESMPEAASREAFEEAGVRGNLEVSSQSLRLHSPPTSLPLSRKTWHFTEHLVPVAGHAWQMDQQGGRQDPLHVRVESYGGAAAVAGDGRPRTEVGE